MPQHWCERTLPTPSSGPRRDHQKAGDRDDEQCDTVTILLNHYEVFVTLWEKSLVEYEALPGIDWAWLAMHGVMTKAILGEKKAGKHPTDRGKTGIKRSVLTDGRGVPIGLAVERSDPSPDTPQGLCLDTGYDSDEVRELPGKFGFTAHIRSSEYRTDTNCPALSGYPITLQLRWA